MKTLVLLICLCLYTIGYAQVITQKSVTDNEVVPISTLDAPPEYPGGIKAFNTYIATEMKNYVKNQKGKVFVYFVIDTTGQISDVQVKRTFDKEIGDHLVKIIEKSVRWQPGTKDGKPVKTAYMLPVHIDSANPVKN